MSEENRIRVYGFVIMDNHIHIIWKVLDPNLLANVQRDFLKYTAQQVKFDLMTNHPEVLEYFKKFKRKTETISFGKEIPYP